MAGRLGRNKRRLLVSSPGLESVDFWQPTTTTIAVAILLENGGYQLRLYVPAIRRRLHPRIPHKTLRYENTFGANGQGGPLIESDGQTIGTV